MRFYKKKALGALRLNGYEIYKLDQYTRRENLRIHGFTAGSFTKRIRGSDFGLIHHLTRIDKKAKNCCKLYYR